MRNRILNGWNFKRILYMGIGILIIIQSLMLKESFGFFVGMYFASMGLFAFGCASGQCIPDTYKKVDHVTANEELQYEEIKINKD